MLLLHPSTLPPSSLLFLHLSSLHICNALLEAAGVNVVRFAARYCLLCDGEAFIFLARSNENASLGRKIPEGLFDLDGLIYPFQRLVPLVIVGVLVCDLQGYLPVC